jgi:uncharacterized membrane protein SpoIIM required for sporulation
VLDVVITLSAAAGVALVAYITQRIRNSEKRKLQQEERLRAAARPLTWAG